MMQEKESGRILQCIGGIYTVATDSGTVSCKARGVFRKRGMTPYAGDFVTVEQGVMTEILPRKNSIIRPPLANLDQLLFVTSTYKPVPNLLLLDQFMAVAIYKQIQPVLVLTKLDLQDGAALQELYTNAGIPVYPVCYDQPRKSQCLDGKFRCWEIHAAECVVSGFTTESWRNQREAGTWTAYDPTSFSVSAGWRLYCRYARIFYV